MIYRLHHTTRYAYRTPASLGIYLTHLQPRPLPHQHVLRAHVHAEPEESWRRDGTDYFGNDVIWLAFDAAHLGLAITAEAMVKVTPAITPHPTDTPPWDIVVRQAAAADAATWQVNEFVFDSPHAPTNELAVAYAHPSFIPGRPVLEAVLDLGARIYRDFAYRVGATTTTTPVTEVLQRREGVCQDFAHLMISALRGLGLPARYVSGYIHTQPVAASHSHQITDQSHAWAAVWLGLPHGWIEIDPTHDRVVGDQYVTLAWGRDYGDVTPIRGVVFGGDDPMLSVQVTLTEISHA